MAQSLTNIIQDFVGAIVDIVIDPFFLFGVVTGFAVLSITDPRMVIFVGISGMLFLLSIIGRVLRK